LWHQGEPSSLDRTRRRRAHQLLDRSNRIARRSGHRWLTTGCLGFGRKRCAQRGQQGPDHHEPVHMLHWVRLPPNGPHPAHYNTPRGGRLPSLCRAQRCLCRFCSHRPVILGARHGEIAAPQWRRPRDHPTGGRSLTSGAAITVRVHRAFVNSPSRLPCPPPKTRAQASHTRHRCPNPVRRNRRGQAAVTARSTSTPRTRPSWPPSSTSTPLEQPKSPVTGHGPTSRSWCESMALAPPG
jgi:hypothetical protein